MDEIVSFGEWSQERRTQLRLSRPVLAQQVGCSPDMIKKIERDERRPSTQIAELLAEKLRIPEPEKDGFIRRARGEFVPRFGVPHEMPLAEAQATAEKNLPDHNLPLQTTLFIGRDAEIVQINARLADPTCRLLTILGAGGMGKTRLAIEVATCQLQNFTDGLVYVPLAGIPAATPGSKSSTALDPLVNALAEALKLPFHGGASPEAQLLNHLKRKEMLLILDNFEHLLDAADFVAKLLSAAPDIKILATSRERLNLQEEWRFPLGGLLFPRTYDARYVGADHSAVLLFKQRAQQLQPSFDLDSDLSSVLQICQLVAGMPLALELAAAWIHQMPCAQIVQEIEREIDFLSTKLRNVPERHRSTRAVFSYSWDKLTETEKSALQKLSVFRGGFERDAARVAMGVSLGLLSGLVDKSLLSVAESGRYQIHELLRQFVAETFAQSVSAEESARAQHCRYFLQFLHDHAVRLERGVPHQFLLTLQLQQENISAAWTYAVEQALWHEVAQSLSGLHYFYQRCALYRQGLHRISLALQCESSSQFPAQLAQDLLLAKANLLHILGLFDEADTCVQQVLGNGTISQRTQIEAELVSASILEGTGDYAAALVHNLAAGDLLQGSDDWLLHARQSRGSGWAMIMLGQTEAASKPLLQSLDYSQRADDGAGQLTTLTFLGVRARRRNEFAVAARYYEQALQLAQTLGDRLAEGKLFSNLGVIDATSFRLSQAEKHLEAAITIFHDLDLPKNRSMSEGDLGFVYGRLGMFDRAEQFIERSLLVARQVKDRYGEAWALAKLSEIQLAVENPDVALQLAESALSVAEAIGSQAMRMGGLAKMGDALLARGKWDASAESYQQAFTLCEQLEQHAEANLMLAGLAESALRQQQLSPAVAYVERILSSLTTNALLQESISLHIFWVCHQVLQALHDPRATTVLCEGYTLVMTRAAMIDEDATQRSFLTQVASNRQLVEAAAANSLPSL